MRSQRLVVLKFGGSVLHSEATLPLVVHEIYRWRRDGYEVLAVVSALGGRTDALLRESRRVCASAAPESVAPLVALGELHSAALLGLQLDRAGVPASVLAPAAIRLAATGSPLDAAPAGLDVPRVQQSLARHGVVVVPGYVAEDVEGRTVLLGRGGSDLTALFLTHQLRACCCRLIKDVDGLYEHDPARPGPAPRRFATATWGDALATDGTIVQYKAVEFARTHNLEFQLGRHNGSSPTQIGAGPASFSPPDVSRRLRVVLLGLGTVGGGVHDLLTRMPELFEVTRVAVRDPLKHHSAGVERRLITTDALAAAASNADVVVEVMGGLNPARAAIEVALRSGAHVVTANKALVANAGRRLTDLARTCGRMLRFSAAVGGSMPLLELVTTKPRTPVLSVRAIINGTTNYVLDEVTAGASFHDALRAAQKQGFAEADPARDLAGLDAADKLCVIAQTLGHEGLRPDDVPREAVSAETVQAAIGRVRDGHRVRHVATLQLDGGTPRASVRLQALAPEDVLAGVTAEQNAAVVELADGSEHVVRGRGAGRWPTAEAVIADLLEIARSTSVQKGQSLLSGVCTAEESTYAA